jgi:hypothetical protein
VIVGHVMGIPVEESVLAAATAGAAIVSTITIGRAKLGRLARRRRRPRQRKEPSA